MRKERTLSSGSIYLGRLFRKQSEEVGVKHMGEKLGEGKAYPEVYYQSVASTGD